MYLSPLRYEYKSKTRVRIKHLVNRLASLSFIYLEKARQSFFSQTVEAKNMADF